MSNHALLPRRIAIRLSVVASFMIVLSVSGFAEEVLAVNPSVTTARISEETLKDMYLGKSSIWPDGTKVTIVVVKEGPSNEALMKRLNKSQQQFLSGWKKLVFTGKGAMPEFVANEQAMIEYLAKTTGSMGYVGKDAVTPSLRVLPVE